MATPISLECSLQAGFLCNPNEPERFGYLTDFGVTGLTAVTRDLTVQIPVATTSTHLPLLFKSGGSSSKPVQQKVVGVLERLDWNGRQTDPILINCYVSHTNALLLKTAAQSPKTLSSSVAVSWWITDYDQESKLWYEQSYPSSPTTPIVRLSPASSSGPGLDVDLTPVRAVDGLDVFVYRVTASLLPGASTVLAFSNMASKKQVQQWGIQVGSLAPGSIP